MTKYIIYRTDKANAPGWKERTLSHTGAGTSILAEHFDASNGAMPKVGDRLTEFHRVAGFEDTTFPNASTHYRDGDWQVTRVEEYTPEIPLGDYDSIVICYCQYIPVNSPLQPLPPIQVSVASFGDDETARQTWLETQKQPVTAGK
jgi:hypothetical protein